MTHIEDKRIQIAWVEKVLGLTPTTGSLKAWLITYNHEERWGTNLVVDCEAMNFNSRRTKFFRAFVFPDHVDIQKEY